MKFKKIEDAENQKFPFMNSTDFMGKKCKKCGKGKYAETSMQDDWDGLLHCDSCGAEIKRHIKKYEI